MIIPDTSAHAGFFSCQLTSAARIPSAACSTSVNIDSLPSCANASRCSLFRSLSKPSISCGIQMTGKGDCVILSSSGLWSCQNFASPNMSSLRRRTWTLRCGGLRMAQARSGRLTGRHNQHVQLYIVALQHTLQISMRAGRTGVHVRHDLVESLQERPEACKSARINPIPRCFVPSS